ncbi:MAG: ATP-binding protein [Ruminococcus sp.]|nr:ATP-binding protein [Ruminococcus sp.]
MKKILLIILNVIILLIALCTSVKYSGNLRREKTKLNKEAFQKSMDSMKHISQSSLDSEREIVSNWANFLTINDITVDEALCFLSEINTSPEITAQIIDVDTFSGKVSVSGMDCEDYTAVDYRKAGQNVIARLDEINSCYDNSKHIHIIQTYTDPADGMEKVGFCQKVKLLDEKGENKYYILVRAVPISTLKKQWHFLVGYEDAEAGLIKRDGEFVLGLGAMSGDSFTEFIRESNELSDLQINEIESRLMTEDSGTLKLKTPDGVYAYWFYTALLEKSDYLLVGYIPESAFESSSDWTVVFIAGGALLTLFLLDGLAILFMQKLLRRSMKEIQTANNTKTRFLSVMSHDLRTPMNAVVGMTAIASEHLDDSEYIQNYMKKITYVSKQMLQLVNDLLDISKAESGKIILNPVVFSIAELSGNLVNIVRPQAEEKSQRFNVYVKDVKYEYIYADELRINQIFINILTNAVKYTPDGGSVTLTLSEEKSPIGSGSVRIIFTVEDTGAGIPEEYIKVMQSECTQAGDEHFNSAQGTGLGLLIIKQMTDILEGIIDIQSEPQKGTSFRVILDLPIAEKVSSEFILPEMQILIADDDEIFLESVSNTFNSIGVRADTAVSGQQAIEMAGRKAENGEEYGAVFIGWKQQGENMLKTIREIRRCIGNTTPIIIISDDDLSEIEKTARKSGADGFIDKLLFPSTLYYKINELLHLRKGALK